jgi:septum site-determining protein MinC
VKGKQYSIKVYETSIEEEDKFVSFFDANHLLFKDHLIVIHGELSDHIKQYLQQKSLTFIHNITMPISKSRRNVHKIREVKKQQEEEEKAKIEEQERIAEEISRLSHRLENNLKVIDKMVRSGQEISVEGDLLLLNRVNSGATIHTTGNLIVTQIVEGSIRCEGKFMMLSSSSKANIIFQGVEVDNKLLEDKLNRIELKDDKIVITPVLKKEINWASS